MNMTKVSIVIPAYNEEKIITKVINDVKDITKGLKEIIEIIVVNDGSDDNTAEILNNLKGIKVINHNYNNGYGASLKSGIKEARGDYILIMDADGTYPTESIPSLVKHIGTYDMVIGARSSKNLNVPLLRIIPKWFLNKFASFLVKKKIPDLNSGLRIFNKEKCLEFWKLYPERFSFTSTITMAFLSSGYNLKYIPIDYLKRKGKSNVSPSDFYNFNNLLLKMTLLFNPIKIFSTISIFLVLVAIAIAIYSIYFTSRLMDVTVLLLMLSALQIFLFGLIAHVVVKYK